LAAFRKFTVDREGYTDFMYADRKNYVTTGIGNLIDNSPAPNLTSGGPSAYAPALGLPWKHRGSNLPASNQEISDVWELVKSRIDLSQQGGMIYRSLPGNDLFLDSAAINDLVSDRLAINEHALRQIYPNFPHLPADAQLALVSMAWAMGTGRMASSFPHFNAAINSNPPDFLTASLESHMSDANADRNDADRDLLLNAAAVQASGADPTRVYWPNKVSDVVKGGVGLAGFGVAVGLGTAAWYLAKRYF
jgi:GH24 family phage-related lysozyme (muramidase)